MVKPKVEIESIPTIASLAEALDVLDVLVRYVDELESDIGYKDSIIDDLEREKADLEERVEDLL